MKKTIVGFLTIVLILYLSSCGSHPPRVATASDVEELDSNTTGSVVRTKNGVRYFFDRIDD